MRYIKCIQCIILAVFAAASFSCKQNQSSEMEWIGLSADGKTLVEVSTGKPFLMWGVNYDRDYKSRLMDDYWIEEWETAVILFHFFLPCVQGMRLKGRRRI